MIRTKGSGRWLRWAASAAVTAATLGTLVGGVQRVAASNSSDPNITVFAVTGPGIGANKPLIIDVADAPCCALWFTWEVSGANPGMSMYGIGTVSGIGIVDGSWQLATFPVPSGWTVAGLTAQWGFEWVLESHDGSQYIGKWTPGGTLAQDFPVPGGVLRGITYGSDGALWFTGGASADSCGVQGGFIGRMTQSGAVTTFPLPATAGGYNGAHDISFNSSDGPGPGSPWFDLPNQASIGKVTPSSGAVSEFAIPGAHSQCDFLADRDLEAGSDTLLGAPWSGGQRVVGLDGRVKATYPVTDLFSIGGMWMTTAFAGASVERLPGPGGQVVVSGLLDTSYPASAPLVTDGPGGGAWIGVQGAIEFFEPISPPTTPTPISSNGNTSGGVGGGGGASPSASPSSNASPTPVPGFLNFTPSPSPGAGALASAHGNPSSGSGLGIVLGSVAGVVLLASGVAAIVIRRRHTTTTKSPPTP